MADRAGRGGWCARPRDRPRSPVSRSPEIGDDFVAAASPSTRKATPRQEPPRSRPRTRPGFLQRARDRTPGWTKRAILWPAGEDGGGHQFDEGEAGPPHQRAVAKRPRNRTYLAIPEPRRPPLGAASAGMAPAATRRAGEGLSGRPRGRNRLEWTMTRGMPRRRGWGLPLAIVGVVILLLVLAWLGYFYASTRMAGAHSTGRPPISRLRAFASTAHRTISASSPWGRLHLRQDLVCRCRRNGLRRSRAAHRQGAALLAGQHRSRPRRPPRSRRAGNGPVAAGLMGARRDQPRRRPRRAEEHRHPSRRAGGRRRWRRSGSSLRQACRREVRKSPSPPATATATS